MLKKVFIVIISVLFMSFSLSLTLAQQQQQQPPLLPLQVIYGTAKIDNNPLNRTNTQNVVSIRMENLIVIVMDKYEAQATIGNIINDLENGVTASLAQEFLNSEYCSSQVPPIVLSAGATVVGEPDGGADTEWSVRSGSDTFKVKKTQVKVWNGTTWENGTGLEVYQHFGLMDSYKMGDLQTDSYVLEIQNSPNNLYWPDQSTYLLRDPGKAVVGDQFTDKAFIYINDVLVTSPPMPLVLSSVGFAQVDINAPSCHDWLLTLKPGWTWMSYGINKCYYYGPAGPPPAQPSWVEKVDVSTLPQQFTSLAAWFNSVIDPPGAWKVVIGKKGIMDSSTDPSFHSLTYLSPLECYQIRIDENLVAGAIMNLECGQYLDVISMKSGWNWISYPMMIGYYDTPTPPANVNLPNGATWASSSVPAPVADYVFANIVNKYDVVFGQKGIYDPAFPDFSSLHYIAPGQGFKIKLKDGITDLDLVYPSQ